MKKGLMLFLIVFTTLGVSGCGGGSFSAKEVSFAYENASEEAYSDDIPQQTYAERNKAYGSSKNDPCSQYGEQLTAIFEIRNNTKYYMVDTPVVISLLDSEGNKVEGYSYVGFVTMGPKSTSYTAFKGTVDENFKLPKRGSWEPTGEKRDNSNVDSCVIKPDAPKHIKDASGMSIEVLSSDNAPEFVKNNISSNLDTKVQDTYQDDPVRIAKGTGTGGGMEWIYSTDVKFEDVQGSYDVKEQPNGEASLSGSVSATAYNEWGEDILSYAIPIVAVVYEGNEIVGCGFAIGTLGRNGFVASKAGINVDFKDFDGIYVGTSNKTSDLTTSIYIPVLTSSPLFSSDVYNAGRARY